MNRFLSLALAALLLAAASGYSMAFNGGRLVEPMDFSTYVFRAGDLPMLLTLALTVCYVGYLVVLLVRFTLANSRRQASASTARPVDPRLGLLGLLGFLDFLGFWTYRTDGSIFPFVFFLFFGFFGFFFEGKLSGTLMDERYRENQLRARTTANRIALTIIFLAVLLLGQGKIMGSLELTLVAFVIVVVLALALEPLPHILVLDEPLSGVDIDGEKQMMDMLDEIRTRYDLSILLSTHDFATLGQFADKVILLKSEVLKVGTPDEVLSSPEFQEVFHLNLGKGGRG